MRSFSTSLGGLTIYIEKKSTQVKIRIRDSEHLGQGSGGSDGDERRNIAT
jgi:hypothetical protein